MNYYRHDTFSSNTYTCVYGEFCDQITLYKDGDYVFQSGLETSRQYTLTHEITRGMYHQQLEKFHCYLSVKLETVELDPIQEEEIEDWEKALNAKYNEEEDMMRDLFVESLEAFYSIRLVESETL